MDKLRTFPSSAPEADLTQASGSRQAPAAVLEITAPCTCIGVDVPGVGHRHSVDCPRGRIWPYAAAVSPFELVDLGDSYLEEENRRNALLIKLLFASRALAKSRLVPMDESDSRSGNFCLECGMGEHLGVQPHTATCLTGGVLSVIAELVRPFSVKNSNEKEEALVSEPEADPSVSAVEQPGAQGDGIRTGLEQQAVEIVRTVVTKLYSRAINLDGTGDYRSLLVDEEELLGWAKTLNACDRLRDQAGSSESDSAVTE
jgi:hypothetical protein